MTDTPSLYEAWRAHSTRYDAEHAAPEAAPEPAPTQRHDGWTPERQRTFLDAVADGYSAEVACRLAGMSVSSAYAFKKRPAGQAFALGWRAASLLGRDRIADTMLARAVDGYTETVTRPNGDVIERHRFDNRLAMSMLARLDRQAEAIDPGSIAANATARLVAAEFESFLDLLATDSPQARAGLFLARRTQIATGDAPAAAAELAPILTLARADRYLATAASLPCEVDTADLDLAARAGWTAEQWVRAEAAGLIRLASPEPREAAPLPPLHPVDPQEEEADALFWWNGEAREYRTGLPCPDDAIPEYESGDHGDPDYQRSLTPDEAALMAAADAIEAERARAAGMDRRARWLASLRATIAAAADIDVAATGPGTAALPPEEPATAALEFC